MKKVLLIGDSIRCNKPGGYGNFVPALLAGIAEVYQPKDNCRFTTYTHRHLRNWISDLKITDLDVIHWNNGLWDLVRMDGEDENLIPPELYAHNLVRLFNQMKLKFPNAKIVFATSTYIVESQYGPAFYRDNKVIDEYNRIARETLEPLGVTIDDLAAVSKNFTVEDYCDGKTHFTEKAGRILADAVVKSLPL